MANAADYNCDNAARMSSSWIDIMHDGFYGQSASRA